MEQTKSFNISKNILWNAYMQVRKNGGSAGVDGITLEMVDSRKTDILYSLWNRMSSGSYFPKSVLRVDIPKKSGGTRPLGIPTVIDRVAQMTAKMYLEPLLEPLFHPDSYGYRPKKSAHQAVSITRKRCWKYSWVIDLDIKGFFDTIDHELLLKAVRFHNPPAWVILYITRWLKASAEDSNGVVIEREQGTPQGGVISPLLANLFMHYAFDEWMKRTYPHVEFARYADDVVIHCRSRHEAESLLSAVKDRLSDCKLSVHPEKTKIVFCKDDNRKGDYECTEFDFLGFTFRPRHARNDRGQFFVSFSPAISRKAEESIRDTIRSWKVHSRTGSSLLSLISEFNPRLRGWLTYYGAFRRSSMRKICELFHKVLVKWAKNKYRRLNHRWSKAYAYFRRLANRNPKLLAYWELGWCLNF
ncbi:MULTISPECIES: group II intron reverse transcriptase/maturase [unclassified Oceanispirochaeta]|uniref:group II intron reverse transcriptase/maturase n=1 Tax=unclassified Oceanispirochaeta TaxID=2635722 RepID=UPI000E095669|nr:MULTISPECIES: group II intron reverse transcriptase/maturase [unclassified Oceanispirochaeta]MBF9018947.1 group II intron reverse transcriptase/maturase [Oceanispirochaeta sp. M2]NPD75440.1 group II intron reverse transcriptase/maturase [Oceanispirochaeta sp. M1]RDG28711.1 group II intron reverse transcriptase/maturase [Oceanispirochaeta sp. M1]